MTGVHTRPPLFMSAVRGRYSLTRDGCSASLPLTSVHTCVRIASNARCLLLPLRNLAHAQEYATIERTISLRGFVFSMIGRFIFSFIAVFTMGLCAQAQEVKPKWDKQLAIDFLEAQAPLNTAKYPPYPDVWWRETPAKKYGDHMSPSIWDVGTNDPVVFWYWNTKKYPERLLNSAGLEFFSGRKWMGNIVDGIEIVDWRHFGHLAKIYNTPFSDGSKLDYWRVADGGTPNDPLLACLNVGDGLMRKDKNGNILWRRFLIQIKEQPTYATLYRRACYAVIEGEGESLHYSITVGMRANFWPFSYGNMYMLKDDTFLDTPEDNFGNRLGDAPFVIRFDSDLRSPFIKSHDDFYVVDVEELEPLLAKAKAYEDKYFKNAFVYFDGLLIDYLKARGHR